MGLIRCNEELPYMWRLAEIVVCYVVLSHKELTTHNQNYVVLPRPFDRHHLLTNFEH